jgi:hypothetical protein
MLFALAAFLAGSNVAGYLARCGKESVQKSPKSVDENAYSEQIGFGRRLTPMRPTMI